MKEIKEDNDSFQYRDQEIIELLWVRICFGYFIDVII